MGMSNPSGAPEKRFAELVDELVRLPDVTCGADEPGAKNRFGSSGLKVGGRLFAMLVRGSLVVKLPRQRVDALTASGDGERYDPRHDGRLMKEWLALSPASGVAWLPLAREAMGFAAKKR
jgi:hypothetical protein